MWEDILLAVGDVVLDLWPGRSEPEDFFFADVLEVREKTRFPGKKQRWVRLRPLTHQAEGWYACKRRQLPWLTPGRRVFAAVRQNKLIRVSDLPDKKLVNKSEKETES